MRTSRRLAVLALPILAAALAAGPTAGAIAGAGTTAATTASGGTAARTATDLPAPTRTGPVSGAATTAPDGSRPPTLVGVRYGRHDAYDRTVFDFTGGTPAYRVEYGPLMGLGTGTPIALAGPADLRIAFDGAFAYEMATGAPTIDLRRVHRPGLPTLREIKSGGAFEGRILFGAGLADRVGLRVLRLTGPPRIAVDVAHQPRQPFGTATFWGGAGEADRVVVTGVRTGAHPGYDRLVLDLGTAGTPLITVGYTRYAPSTIHIGLTGLSTARGSVAPPLARPLTMHRLRGVSFRIYDNGTASAFVTTSRRTGFRVMLLADPTRIVVDVAH
jgi:hypothetical protein